MIIERCKPKINCTTTHSGLNSPTVVANLAKEEGGGGGGGQQWEGGVEGGQIQYERWSGKRAAVWCEEAEGSHELPTIPAALSTSFKCWHSDSTLAHPPLLDSTSSFDASFSASNALGSKSTCKELLQALQSSRRSSRFKVSLTDTLCGRQDESLLQDLCKPSTCIEQHSHDIKDEYSEVSLEKITVNEKTAGQTFDIEKHKTSTSSFEGKASFIPLSSQSNCYFSNACTTMSSSFATFKCIASASISSTPTSSSSEERTSAIRAKCSSIGISSRDSNSIQQTAVKMSSPKERRRAAVTSCCGQGVSSFETRASSVALLIAVLLAGVPCGIARGGKGAKGAGGGATRYGFRGVNNPAAYEMTWEDIVLAMELSAMCFGALIALCIVSCCAYKICGPAEEEDFRNYRPAFRQPRLPPELYREIYTLPGASQEKAIVDNIEAPPGSMTPRISGDDPTGVANGRTRVIGGRLVGGTGREGVAPRLAQHLHDSSLDLTCPPGAQAAHRALSEPRQPPV